MKFLNSYKKFSFLEVMIHIITPSFIILNCLTIKHETLVHYLFTFGFAFAVILAVIIRIKNESSFNILFRGNKVFVLVFILGIWLIVSALLSENSADSFRSALRANFFFIVIYFLSLIYTEVKQIKSLIISLIVVACIVSLSVVFEFVLKLQLINEGEVIRYDGLIGSPNLTAFSIVIGTLLIIPYLKNQKYLVFLFLLNLLALFLTFSRSAWLLFGFAFLFYLFMTYPLKKYWQVYLITISVGVFIVGLFQDTIYDLARLKYGITYRDYLWMGAINITIDYPFFGVGPENFSNYIKDYIHGVEEGSEKWKILSYGFSHAHSMILTNFAELGIPGGLLVLSILVGFFIMLKRNFTNLSAEERICIAICMGFFIRGFFESGGFLSNGWFAFDIYMWLVVIISLNLTQIKKLY